MERSYRSSLISLVSLKRISSLLLFLSALSAFGDLTRAEAQFPASHSMSVESQEPESYPESRFGAPPARELVQHEIRETETDGEGRRLASVGAIPKLKGEVNKRAGVQEVALIAGDLGFFPKTVFVTRDIPVRLFITGASKKTLCVMLDAFQVKKQVRSQKIEEISFVPSVPGQFRFYCPINGIEGTLFVKDPNAMSSRVSILNSALDSAAGPEGRVGLSSVSDK